jgi:hypothetical protein
MAEKRYLWPNSTYLAYFPYIKIAKLSFLHFEAGHSPFTPEGAILPLYNCFTSQSKALSLEHIIRQKWQLLLYFLTVHSQSTPKEVIQTLCKCFMLQARTLIWSIVVSKKWHLWLNSANF